MRVERCEDNGLETHEGIKNHNTSFWLFSDEKSRPLRYEFEIINHHQAILHTKASHCPQVVIEEFLFYSGFISHIETKEGQVLYHQPKKEILSLNLLSIQPSQLYINEKKLNQLLTWIKRPEQVIVSVIKRGKQWVCIDGHTRLKVAQLLGFKEVSVYVDEFEPCIDDFVELCRRNQKLTINDLPIISHEDYQIQWSLFCQQYFRQKQS